LLREERYRVTNVTEEEDVKNLITPEQTKPTDARTKRTEVERAQDALAEAILFGAAQKPSAQGTARIILGLDCTSSMGEFVAERKITPEVAATIAQALFAERSGLQVQLAHFRGDDGSPKRPRQFRVSKWYTDPVDLARAMTAIEHWPGWTQHCRLLRHAVAEAEKQAIQELVIISDAFEQRTPMRPQGDDLEAARVHARRLRSLGVQIAAGFKGVIRNACPLDRAGIGAEHAFREIVEEAGYCFLLDPAELGARFKEIATAATLAAKGDAAGAQALLQHLRTVPFDMVVGEQVATAKCKPGG
jgi:hypothetical protein